MCDESPVRSPSRHECRRSSAHSNGVAGQGEANLPRGRRTERRTRSSQDRMRPGQPSECATPRRRYGSASVLWPLPPGAAELVLRARPPCPLDLSHDAPDRRTVWAELLSGTDSVRTRRSPSRSAVAGQIGRDRTTSPHGDGVHRGRGRLQRRLRPPPPACAEA